MNERQARIAPRRCAALLATGLLALTGVTRADERPLTNTVFVAFDIETTGLNQKTARIVEIGAVRFANGWVLASTNWLVNPGIPIPRGAQNIHGISDRDVAASPVFPAVYPAFTNFLSGAVLLAHNARFDTGVIAAEARRNKLPLPEDAVLDTLALSRRWYPKVDSHTLESLAARLKIERGPAHRGGGDALTLMRVFEAACAALPPGTAVTNLTATAPPVPFDRKRR